MADESDLEIDQPDAPEAAESPEPKGEKPKGPKDKWDKLQVVAPLLTGAALAIVGYFLTGSVNQTLQKGQLQFNNVKEMQELLTKLGDPKATLQEAKTTAVALAAYGSFSIAPLLNEIQSGELNRPTAGEYGLQAEALSDPEHTCPALSRVLDNRTAAYNSLTHRAALRILGRANCWKTRNSLQAYAGRLQAAASSAAGFTAFQQSLAEEPEVTRETVDLLQADLAKTLKLLDQAKE